MNLPLSRSLFASGSFSVITVLNGHHFNRSTQPLESDMSSAAALSYRESDIVTVLILPSFLLLENVINWLFDRLLFCGLIGQIAIGVAWGTPGAKWLSEGIENAIMQLGYLGLILLVYEGEFECFETRQKIY